MSDVADFIADLKHFEGVIPWMYLDTHGFVTVGVGNMLPVDDAAVALPFENLRAQRRASADEIRRAYSVVLAMKPAMPAKFYQRDPRIELPDFAIDDLLRTRLTSEFLPGLGRLFSGFPSFPPPARAALVDMAFNLGLGGLGKFQRLMAAVRAQEWSTAAAECDRSTSRPERNAWCRQRFLAAIGAPVPTAPPLA